MSKLECVKNSLPL